MERICRGQNPPLRQNLPRFKSSVIQYIRLNIQQDQVIYFSGFFVVGGILSHHDIYLLQCISLHQRFIQIKFCIFFPGGFCPDNNFTFFSCGPIRFTLNTEQIMFWEGFVPGKILSQVGFSPLIYHSITINIHQDQVLYFSSFFVVGGFCPNNNYTVFYVHHQGKQCSNMKFNKLWQNSSSMNHLEFSIYVTCKHYMAFWILHNKRSQAKYLYSKHFCTTLFPSCI